MRFLPRSLAAVSLVVLVGAGAAAAQQAGVTITFSPPEGPHGTAVDVSGACGAGGNPYVFLTERPTSESGDLYSFSTILAAQPDQTFAGQIVVPDDAPAGNYAVGLACIEGDTVDGPIYGVTQADGLFVVTEPEPVATTGTTLPTLVRTGPTSSSTPLALLAVLLVATGVFCVSFARRR